MTTASTHMRERINVEPETLEIKVENVVVHSTQDLRSNFFSAEEFMQTHPIGLPAKLHFTSICLGRCHEKPTRMCHMNLVA